MTTTTNVYRFAELSTGAQSIAVDQLRERLGGDWWDDHDTELVQQAIVYQLAEAFHTPGWDTYGSGDFPGIDHVSVRAWDLDRGQYLALSGYLDRDSAPALPWVDGIDQVDLTAHRHGTTVIAVYADLDCTCSADHYLQTHELECPQIAGSPVTDEQREALEDAVADALHKALKAGTDELEYKTGDEYARERADDYEFTADGHLY